MTLNGTQLESGCGAVALAALDAGVVVASAYPGTPTTDILEFLERQNQLKAVWSVNEKVAYESALGAAIAGQRALVAMKQMGLNVASDAFLNSCPSGVNAGLVLVVGDDAECHSSSHKEDTRHYCSMAEVILLEPADSQECYAMTREAFDLSERFQMPVMIRLSTRVACGSTPIVRSAPTQGARLPAKWTKNPQRFCAVPPFLQRRFQERAEMQDSLAACIEWSSFGCKAESLASKGSAVLCTGVGYSFAREFSPAGYGIFKLAGMPYPVESLRKFIQHHAEIVVLEEGDPILEQLARALSTETRIRGRLSGDLQRTGELRPLEVRALFGEKMPSPAPEPFAIPLRLPQICKPCGYNKVFAALKQIPEIVTPGDIGCNTLGGLPPYSAIDGFWAMGSSIGVACGLAAVGIKRIVAVIGDSTFLHAGLPPLIEAIHKRYDLTILLLDNGASAMTGGQEVAHRSNEGADRGNVDLIKLIESVGAACTPFDPHKLGVGGITELIESSLAAPGVRVLLYRSQCGLFTPGYFTEAPFALPKGG